MAMLLYMWRIEGSGLESNTLPKRLCTPGSVLRIEACGQSLGTMAAPSGVLLNEHFVVISTQWVLSLLGFAYIPFQGCA